MHQPTKHLWSIITGTICFLVTIYMIAPLLVVLSISFSSASFLTFPPPGFSLQWYENLLGNPVWLNSLVTSVKVLVPTAVIATALGTAAAYGLSRSAFPGVSIIRGILMAPIVVPVIITGAGLFNIYRGFGLNGTLTGLIIGHTILTIPYVVATVTSGLAVVDRRLEQAAATLGAAPHVVFLRVVFPLIRPSILSGLLFAMVTSFDELIVSLFISSPTVRPVTVQMWSNLQGDVDPTIAAIATLLLVISLAALLADDLMRRKSNRKGA